MLLQRNLVNACPSFKIPGKKGWAIAAAAVTLMLMLNEYLPTAKGVAIKQIREGIEYLGFEGRNRYEIYSAEKELLGRAEEKNQGMAGMLFRQVAGHWRSFEIEVTDSRNQKILNARHPFRIYFQRLDIEDGQGRTIGEMEKRFSILSKEFVLQDEMGANQIHMSSGFFKVWTFPFVKNGKEVAHIRKKWSGSFGEIFTDADSFLLEFNDASLSLKERQLLLAASFFIDLLYFENNKANVLSILDS